MSRRCHDELARQIRLEAQDAADSVGVGVSARKRGNSKLREEGQVLAGVRTITEWSEFEELAPQWDELVRSANGSPFSSHDGVSAWRKSFGAHLRPFIPTAWRDGLLVAAAPLGIADMSLSPRLPFMKVRRLQLLADEHIGYSGWLAAPGDHEGVVALLQAISATANAWDLAVLEPFAGSEVIDQINVAAEELEIPLMIDMRFQSGVADLAGGWEAYLSRRSSNFRKNVRVAQKRVSATNHRILTEADGGEAVLDRILRLSAKSWKASGGTAAGVSPAAMQYLRNLWILLGPKGIMKLLLLEIDGAEVAGVVNLQHNDTCYGLLTDFDERYAQLSPGRYLISFSMERAYADGAQRFDLLRRTHFLEGFADQFTPLMRLRLFPSRNRAFLALKVETGLRPIANKMWNMMRGPKKRRGDLKAVK